MVIALSVWLRPFGITRSKCNLLEMVLEVVGEITRPTTHRSHADNGRVWVAHMFIK